MKREKFQKIILPLSLVITCIFFNILISGHYSHKDLSYDEKLYNWIALAIAHGENYYIEGDNKVDISIEVTPFYSAFVAATYLVGGEIQRNPIILNIILNCLTILLLFFTIKLITQNVFVSFFTSFTFIFYFLLWGLNFSIMMEIITVFCLTTFLYFYSQYYIIKVDSFLYWSSAIFSFLALINNRFIVLLAIFLVFQFMKSIFEKKSFQKLFIYPTIIAILVISPWFIRQAIVFNQFVFFTPTWNNVVANNLGILNKVPVTTDADAEVNTINKPNNYSYYAEVLKKDYGEDDPIRGPHAFTTEKYNNLVKNINYQESKYWTRFKRYFTLYYKDFEISPNDYRLFAPTGIPSKLIQLFILFPLLLFSFLGIIIAIKKKDGLILLLGLLFFSHLLLHVVIHFIPRYRLTILPVLVIISSYSITHLLKILRSFKIFSNIAGKII